MWVCWCQAISCIPDYTSRKKNKTYMYIYIYIITHDIQYLLTCNFSQNSVFNPICRRPHLPRTFLKQLLPFLDPGTASHTVDGRPQGQIRTCLGECRAASQRHVDNYPKLVKLGEASEEAPPVSIVAL